MGEVGKRLSEIDAAEGAAGNLSLCVRRPLEITEFFTEITMIDLPAPVPDLAGANLIVTGSGRRLREIAEAPDANLACIVVLDGGMHGMMFTSPDALFKRVTSLIRIWRFITTRCVSDRSRSYSFACAAEIHHFFKSHPSLSG